jgi:hypothetical protein
MVLTQQHFPSKPPRSELKENTSPKLGNQTSTLDMIFESQRKAPL